MNTVATVGHHTLQKWREFRYIAAVSWGFLMVVFLRSTWSRAVREEFYSQLMSNGLGAWRFIAYVAVALGISIVAQALIWMDKVDQDELLGPLLIIMFVRETGPVLTNLLVIARSGTTLTAELGRMKIAGEVRVLDSQGLDPFIYLVVPRVSGIVVSVFFLNMVFILITFVSGYFFGTLLGASSLAPLTFVQHIITSVTPIDVINLMAKTILPAFMAGVIFCSEGLGVGISVTKIAGATQRALSRSVIMLFMISAIITLLTYL